MTDIPTPEKLGYIPTPEELDREKSVSWRVRQWMIDDMKKGFLVWTLDGLMPDFPRSYPEKYLYYGERLAVIESLAEDFKGAGWDLRVNRRKDMDGNLSADSSIVLDAIKNGEDEKE